MRNIYRILLLSVLACGAGAAHAENEVSYLSQIGISGREVVKQDREVQLSMQVDMSRLRIRTQHTVALTPVLVSEDGSREAAFPPIVIDGARATASTSGPNASRAWSSRPTTTNLRR